MTDHTTPSCHFADHDCFLLGHECKCCTCFPGNYRSGWMMLVMGLLIGSTMGVFWFLL